MSDDYSKKTVAKLKELLKKRKLDTSGVKKDLIERLEEDDQRLAEELVEDVEEVEDKPKSRKSKTKAVKKAPKKKKPKTPEPSEEEVDEDEDSSEEEPPKVMKKSTAKAIPKKKKPVTPESSLEDEVEESEDEEVAESEEAEVESSETEPVVSEVESSEGEPEPTPKKTKSAGKPTKKLPPPEKPVKKTKSSKKEEEGIFGSLTRVDEVLCEERNSLDIFRPHTEKGSLPKLVEKIFQASSVEKAKLTLGQYISPVEECMPQGVVAKHFQIWLKQIVDDLIERLTVPTGDVEPKFDSSLGIYRIGSYAFQMDPKTMSTALVFAYVSNGKIVPLSAKTLKECPKEYTLWHEHHSDRSPPTCRACRPCRTPRAATSGRTARRRASRPSRGCRPPTRSTGASPSRRRGRRRGKGRRGGGCLGQCARGRQAGDQGRGHAGQGPTGVGGLLHGASPDVVVGPVIVGRTRRPAPCHARARRRPASRRPRPWVDRVSPRCGGRGWTRSRYGSCGAPALADGVQPAFGLQQQRDGKAPHAVAVGVGGDVFGRAVLSRHLARPEIAAGGHGYASHHWHSHRVFCQPVGAAQSHRPWRVF